MCSYGGNTYFYADSSQQIKKERYNLNALSYEVKDLENIWHEILEKIEQDRILDSIESFKLLLEEWNNRIEKEIFSKIENQKWSISEKLDLKKCLYIIANTFIVHTIKIKKPFEKDKKLNKDEKARRENNLREELFNYQKQKVGSLKHRSSNTSKALLSR